MKRIQLSIVGLMLLGLGLLLVANASAEDGATVTPSQLTVAGTRGSVETRTLLLRATEALTDVQVISLDLSQADGKQVLPASAIQADLAATEVEANGLLTIPLTIDLHGAPSGQFSGDLVVRFHGGSVTVPVTTTVKDPWPWPLFVLLVGVGLAVAFTAYRSKGQPHDKVLVRVGELRAQMRGDPKLRDEAAKLAKRFRMRIAEHLVDTETALQAEEWEGAQQAVTRAEEVWARWRKGRDDWLAQQDYYVELSERLEEFSAQALTVQAVSRGLEDAMREAPDMAGPNVLRDRLQALADQLNRYARIQAKLGQLNVLRTQLPKDLEKAWGTKSQGLEGELDALKADNDAGYQALEGKVDTALTELNQVLSEAGKAKVVADGARDVKEVLQRLLGPAPSARALPPEVKAAWASLRLRLFSGTSYVLAVVFLVGVGFGELYGANATFGANAWTDYFTLLAWGFGAEATRAAVTEVVRSWGVPGVK